MKRYLKHIFLALTATLMAVSCLEELEIETPTFGDEVVTLVPRVQSFANRYVTKSEYVGKETMISKYTVLVFNKDGNLVVEMEKKKEEKACDEEKKDCKFLRQEFCYCKFHQTLALPDNVDRENIEAYVKHGVLKIKVPKLPVAKIEDEKRVIEVK